jgi:hypothetical protein
MKAQVAIEFMIIFGMFLAATIVISLAVWNNVASEDKSYIEFEAGRIIGLSSSSINTAYLEGDGFSITLALPDKIGLLNYTMQLDGNTIWLHALNTSYSRRLLTNNITGSFSKGQNRIKNVNGTVVIS